VIVGNQVKEAAVQIDRHANKSRTIQSALAVLLVQGYRWTLSLRAKVLLLSLLIAISVIIFFGPFLAVTHRVDADILVVEGWSGPYAIQFAAKEFNSHR
jgi:hypothetical protein